jgi:myo-inositol-1(or 4)-monophosphatase
VASNAHRDDAELLFSTVREAGQLALARWREEFRHWRKSDGTPVTDVDLAVDAFLKDKLGRARPDYGWLSEETTDDLVRLERRLLWIADPIDGTRAFAARGDEWCVAVALIEESRPVIGAIFRPVRDEFYSAVAGEGAALNGSPLVLGDGASLEGAKVIGNAGALTALARKVPIEPLKGSNVPLAMRLAGVAAGRFSAALSTTPKYDWDLAAGDLLVHEAGGIVTRLDGRSCAYNRIGPRQEGYVAGAPAIHAALMKLLGES